MEVTEARCCLGCLNDESFVQIENKILDSKIIGMYKSLVQVEISSITPDLLKVTLCENCVAKLLIILHFQEECLKSIRSLKSKLGLEIVAIKEEPGDDVVVPEVKICNEPIEEQKSPKNDDIFVADTKMEPEEIIEDVLSDASTTDSWEIKWKAQENIVQPTVKPKFRCYKCDKTFLSQQLVTEHIQISHMRVCRYRCAYCEEFFLNAVVYRKHIEKEHPKARSDLTFICQDCGFTTKFQESIRTHRAKFHPPKENNMMFKCTICGKTFEFQAQLNLHFKLHRGSIIFYCCQQCGVKFMSKEALKKHAKQHKTIIHDPKSSNLPKVEEKKLITSAKTSKTDDKRPPNESNEKNDIKSDSKIETEDIIKDYDDIFDEPRLKISEKLPQLKRSTTRKKIKYFPRKNKPQFSCDLCDKIFKRKLLLEMHNIKYHTSDDMKIICDVCGKTFSVRGDFRAHFIKHHTAEKSYSCEQCGRKFETDDELQQHTKNEKRRLIKCKMCHKMLQKCSLNNHITVVHSGLKIYKCTVCMLSFMSNFALESHIKTHRKSKLTKEDKGE